MNREQILQAAQEAVTRDRNTEYGEPEDCFDIIAAFWEVYLGFGGITATDVANMMVLLKMARIMNGKPKPDSFIDIAGYAACGGEIATKEAE